MIRNLLAGFVLLSGCLFAFDLLAGYGNPLSIRLLASLLFLSILGLVWFLFRQTSTLSNDADKPPPSRMVSSLWIICFVVTLAFYLYQRIVGA